MVEYRSRACVVRVPVGARVPDVGRLRPGHRRDCGAAAGFAVAATVGQRSHVPDFFVRLGNGDGRLVDVRHPNRVDAGAAQFDLTRRICDSIGWEYEVFTGFGDPVAEQNVRWLAGYRQDRCAPSDETFAAIIGCFADPIPLGVGVRRVGRSTGASKDVVMANVLHLLWRRQLSANLRASLSLDAEVSV